MRHLPGGLVTELTGKPLLPGSAALFGRLGLDRTATRQQGKHVGTHRAIQLTAQVPTVAVSQNFRAEVVDLGPHQAHRNAAHILWHFALTHHAVSNAEIGAVRMRAIPVVAFVDPVAHGQRPGIAVIPHRKTVHAVVHGRIDPVLFFRFKPVIATAVGEIDRIAGRGWIAPHGADPSLGQRVIQATGKSFFGAGAVFIPVHLTPPVVFHLKGIFDRVFPGILGHSIVGLDDAEGVVGDGIATRIVGIGGGSRAAVENTAVNGRRSQVFALGCRVGAGGVLPRECVPSLTGRHHRQPRRITDPVNNLVEIASREARAVLWPLRQQDDLSRAGALGHLVLDHLDPLGKHAREISHNVGIFAQHDIVPGHGALAAQIR